MKYCIDDKIIQDLALLLQLSLNVEDMSEEQHVEYLTKVCNMLKRVKNKQYDLTSERRLL